MAGKALLQVPSFLMVLLYMTYTLLYNVHLCIECPPRPVRRLFVELSTMTAWRRLPTLARSGSTADGGDGPGLGRRGLLTSACARDGR